jgi:hypothetical protein
LLGWGPRLADIATNATAAVSHGALERIVEATGGQLVRVALKNSDALPFDLVTPGVTASLKGIGATEGAQTSNRTAVRPFFT